MSRVRYWRSRVVNVMLTRVTRESEVVRVTESSRV